MGVALALAGTSPIPLAASAEAAADSVLDFCENKADGNYWNPEGLETYIACSNQLAYVMPCPAGLLYDMTVGRPWGECMLPRNVDFEAYAEYLAEYESNNS